MGIHLSSSHPAGFIAHLPQQSKGKTINMSHFRNTDTMNSAQGEFHSRVKPSEPLTTKGHAPGVKVGNDAVPEFHAETHPPGTAPKENTFQRNPVNEVPGQAQNPDTQATTAASETLPGASWHPQEGALWFDRCGRQPHRSDPPEPPRPPLRDWKDRQGSHRLSHS